MVKSELIRRIFEAHPHLYEQDVEKIIDAILETIVGAMQRGERVELRGFGAFSVRTRSERNGRNPKTGAYVTVAKKAFPYFKAGKEMRMRLNQGDQSASG